MLLAYKIVGQAGWTTLFDESKSDSLERFEPQFEYNIQVSQGFGSSFQSISPLGNRVITVPLPKFSKIYSDTDAALDAVRTMDNTLGGVKVHILVAQGKTSQYYINATLKRLVPNVVGQTVEYTMTFEAESVTNVKPTT